MKCIEADCNNERMEGKTYCKDCEEFVLSENMERKTINKVICGNAVQELKDIPNESVDLIFVDPPYNLGKDYGNIFKDNVSLIEYYSWCDGWLLDLIRVLKPTGQLFIMNLPRHLAHIYTFLMKKKMIYKNWISWVRNDNSPYSKKTQFKPNHQDILRFVKTKDFHWDWRGDPRKPIWHKDKRVKDLAGQFDTWNDITYVKGNSKEKTEVNNQLPIKLLDRIIKIASKEGDIILDCFGGSGSTAISCIRNKRKYIIIEQNKNYVEIINKRINKEKEQTNLL